MGIEPLTQSEQDILTALRRHGPLELASVATRSGWAVGTCDARLRRLRDMHLVDVVDRARGHTRGRRRLVYGLVGVHPNQPTPLEQHFGALRRLGVASATDVANALGCNRATCKLYLGRLEEAGRIVRAGIRRFANGGQPAILWRVACD